MIKKHGVRGPALSSGTQIRRISEHAAQGDMGPNDLHTMAHFQADYPSPTTVQIAHDITHIIVGREHFHKHDGLEQNRSRLLAGFLHGHGTRNVEVLRSEERRVGKECRSRWSPYH